MDDHRQAPCADGQHTIPWPPRALHRHPSTVAAPLAALGCVICLLALGFLAGLGAFTVWQWL